MNRSFSIGQLLDLDSKHTISDALFARIFGPHAEFLKKFKLLRRGGLIDRRKLLRVWATMPESVPLALQSVFACVLDLLLVDVPLVLRNTLIDNNLLPEEATVADMAAIIALDLPVTAGEIIAKYQPATHRRIKCFYPHGHGVPKLPSDIEAPMKRLEEVLADEFVKQMRTRSVRIFPARSGSTLRLEVMRGDELRRMSVINARTHEPECAAFHPERRDTITFDARFGDVRIHAQRNTDIPSYLSHFAQQFFGDCSLYAQHGVCRYFAVDRASHWMSTRMAARDVVGLDEVILTEFAWRPRGSHCRPVRIISPDGLELVTGTLKEVMNRTHIPVAVNMQFNLLDRRVRHARIEHPNSILLYDDEDADVLFKFLRQRGIINSQREANDGLTGGLWQAIG